MDSKNELTMDELEKVSGGKSNNSCVDFSSFFPIVCPHSNKTIEYNQISGVRTGFMGMSFRCPCCSLEHRLFPDGALT